MATPPQTLPGDFFSKQLGMKPPATLPADFFSKQEAAPPSETDHLKSEGFLESAWRSLTSPVAAAKEMLTPHSRAEKEAQVQKALNWADRFITAHKTGTDAEKKAVNDEGLVSLPFGSTVYKAKEGNVGGALGDVAGMAAMGGIAKASGNPVVQGAAKGAGKALIETRPLTIKGIEFPVPTTLASAAAGGQAASMMGLPRTVGTVAGGVAPLVRGAIKGGKAVLAERKVAAEAAKIPPDVLAQLTRESGFTPEPPPVPEPMAAPQGQPIPSRIPQWEDVAALQRLQADQAARAGSPAPPPVEPAAVQPSGAETPRPSRPAYSDPEVKALAEYRSESDPVNGGLRRNESPHPDVTHIDNALAKSSLPEDTVLYRGFSKPTGYAAGDTFTDSGFSSTTSDKELAALEFGRRGDVAVIRVPKGTNAVRMSDISHPDVWAPPDQGETLLPRGMQYRVTKTEFDPTLGPGGKTVLHLDATSPAVPTPAAPEVVADAPKGPPLNPQQMTRTQMEAAGLTSDQLAEALFKEGRTSGTFPDEAPPPDNPFQTKARAAKVKSLADALSDANQGYDVLSKLPKPQLNATIQAAAKMVGEKEFSPDAVADLMQELGKRPKSKPVSPASPSVEPVGSGKSGAEPPPAPASDRLSLNAKGRAVLDLDGPMATAMRKVDADAQRLIDYSDKMRPPSGTIGVGKEGVHEGFTGWSIRTLLREVGRGKSVAEASDIATKELLDANKLQNSRNRDYLTQRWERNGVDKIDRAAKQLEQAMGEHFKAGDSSAAGPIVTETAPQETAPQSQTKKPAGRAASGASIYDFEHAERAGRGRARELGGGKGIGADAIKDQFDIWWNNEGEGMSTTGTKAQNYKAYAGQWRAAKAATKGK